MILTKESVVTLSQELDTLLNKYYQGEVTIDEVNKKREELYEEISKTE